MSAFDQDYLENNTLIGFTGKRGKAWWAANGNIPSHFDGPVPLERARDFLGWEPVKVTIMEEGPDGEAVPLLDWKDRPQVAVKNPRTNRMMGVFGESYPDTSYRERLLDGLEAILDDNLETKIGSVVVLDGGAKAVVQIETPENLTHSSGEEIRPWIAAYSSLDGSMATTFKSGVTRIVCDNTFNMFKAEGGKVYRYKNTANSSLKVATAREALDLLEKVSEGFFAEIDRMLAVEFSATQWQNTLDILIPVPEEEGKGRTRSLNRHEALTDFYTHDSRVNSFVGTQWGAFQAFSTHEQHATTVRKGESEYQRNTRKMLNGQFTEFDMRVLGAMDTVLQAA